MVKDTNHSQIDLAIDNGLGQNLFARRGIEFLAGIFEMHVNRDQSQIQPIGDLG